VELGRGLATFLAYAITRTEMPLIEGEGGWVQLSYPPLLETERDSHRAAATEET